MRVNAIRMLAGIQAANFTGTITAGTVIKAVHVLELRSALNDALAVLGFAVGNYTDSSLSGGVNIKAVHLQELRNRTHTGT